MTKNTITVQIRSRRSDEPIYTTELPGDTPSDVKMRIALERAVSDRADLSWADLSWANLRGADLSWADLSYADLRDADLSEVRSLWDTTGNRQHIKSMQIDTWDVTYTSTHMQIGCQLHPLDRWWGFSDAQIDRMDGKALEWWHKWKPVLQQIVSMSPAEPGAEDVADEHRIRERT